MGALSASEASIPFWCAGETAPSSATAGVSVFKDATLNSQYSLEKFALELRTKQRTIKSTAVTQWFKLASHHTALGTRLVIARAVCTISPIPTLDALHTGSHAREGHYRKGKTSRSNATERGRRHPYVHEHLSERTHKNVRCKIFLLRSMSHNTPTSE